MVWDQDGQEVLAPMRLRKGNVGKLLALMPDGNNVLVGSQQPVTMQRGSSEERTLSRARFQILNEQRDRNPYVLDQSYLLDSESRLTALTTTPDGKTVVAGIRHGNELGMVVWDLSLDGLLEAGCQQVDNDRAKLPKENSSRSPCMEETLLSEMRRLSEGTS